MLVFSRTRDHSEDFHKFRENTLDYLKSIYSGTSADIQTLILDLIWGLLMKVKVPEEEASKVLVNVKEGDDVGLLFENLEPWDWKGANEELKRERERADAAEARAEEAEAKAEANAKARIEEAEANAKAKVEEAEANAEARVKILEERLRQYGEDPALLYMN